MRNLAHIFALSVFALLASCQTPEQIEVARERAAEQRERAANAYFPVEMEDNVWLNLADFKEPNLFRDNDNSFTSRHRLSIAGISCTIYVIRIDESISGKLAGKVSQRNKCQNVPTEARLFRPSAMEFQELKSLIIAANMFKFYPEVWSADNDDDVICLDGNMLIFERRSIDGYSVSSANAQCDAPPQVRAVAHQFVKISGNKAAAGLLR